MLIHCRRGWHWHAKADIDGDLGYKQLWNCNEGAGSQGTRRWDSSAEAYGSLGKECLCTAINAIGIFKQRPISYLILYPIFCTWPLISNARLTFEIGSNKNYDTVTVAVALQRGTGPAPVAAVTAGSESVSTWFTWQAQALSPGRTAGRPGRRDPAWQWVLRLLGPAARATLTRMRKPSHDGPRRHLNGDQVMPNWQALRTYDFQNAFMNINILINHYKKGV
jgi:hypothetical protein